jgi:hypothetical protein
VSAPARSHTPPAPGSLLALAAGVAGWGLSPPSVLAPAALDHSDWRELLRIISGHRLGGFLLEAADGDGFPLTSAQREELLYVHGSLVRRVLRLESALAEIVGLLTSLGIDHRVLKGAALAHTVYPDATARPYADVDVLVRRRDLYAAIDGLHAIGARGDTAEPRPGFFSRFAKSVELIGADGVSIDLHQAIAPGVWTVRMDPDELFLTRVEVALPVPGATVYGLGPAERFVHACFHATVGSRQLLLIPLRDVVQTAVAPDFDERAALDLATSWRASSVVAAAVDLAWEVLRPAARPALVEWASSYRPDGRDERLFTRGRGGREVQMVRAIPGLRHKLAYAGALLFPSTAYLAERGQTRAAHLRRGIPLLRGRR